METGTTMNSTITTNNYNMTGNESSKLRANQNAEIENATQKKLEITELRENNLLIQRTQRETEVAKLIGKGTELDLFV